VSGINRFDDPHNGKHEHHRAKLEAKRQRILGLSAVLQMHEDIPYDSRDLPYIKQLKFRIAKARSQLRNMGQ
jgi:hypothetical protein